MVFSRPLKNTPELACVCMCGRLNSGPVCLHGYSYVHKSEMHFSPLVEFENTLQSEPVLYFVYIYIHLTTSDSCFVHSGGHMLF